MFAVVEEVKRKEKGLKRFTRAKITSQKVSISQTECFFIIRAEKKKNKLPFEDIINYAGGLSGSILFPEDTALLNTNGFNLFKPQKLQKMLLIYSALSFVSQGFEGSACICDSEGLYQSFMHKLVPFVSSLHIVCGERRLYEQTAQQLLFEYGISVTLSEKFDKRAENSGLIVSHRSREIPLTYNGILFTNEKRPFLSQKCFSSGFYELCDEFDALRPEGINKMDFASALYEKCGVEISSLFKNLDNRAL